MPLPRSTAADGGRRPRRWRLAAGLLLACFALLPAAPARAHAILESTDPGIGSQIEAAPAAVTLRFSEAVTMNAASVEVLSPDGTPVRTGAPRHGDNDRTVVADLPSGLATSSYLVVWHVVSADSHPIAGTFSFGYGVPPGAGGGDLPSDRAVVLLVGTFRFLAYAGVVALIGTLAFLAGLWPAGIGGRRPRRLAVAGWTASVAGTVGLFVLQGPFGAGRGLGGLADLDLAAQTLSGRFGQLLLARLVVLALIGAWAWWELRRGVDTRVRVNGLVLGVALLSTFSLAGHAGEDRWVLLAVPADAAHLAAASVWLGGLLVLVTCLLARPARPAEVAVPITAGLSSGGSVATLPDLGRPDPEGPDFGRPDFEGPESGTPAAWDGPPDLLRRWSTVAQSCVIVLVVTGTFQAWRTIRSLPALTGTDYGQLLLFKLYGFAVILILAAFARRWVRRHTGPSAPGPDAPSLRTMRLSVGAEAVLGLVVLALTATLVGTVPARQSYGPPLSATVNGQGVDGTPVVMYLDIGPTRVGSQTVYLSTHNADGYVIPFATAGLTLTQPGTAPLRFPLSEGTAPGYATGQVIVPKPGRWSITIEMTTPDDQAFAGTTGYDVN